MRSQGGGYNRDAWIFFEDGHKKQSGSRKVIVHAEACAPSYQKEPSTVQPKSHFDSLWRARTNNGQFWLDHMVCTKGTLGVCVCVCVLGVWEFWSFTVQGVAAIHCMQEYRLD